MYSVILVDDEKSSLDILEQSFKWESYDFKVAGTFTNAKDALRYIRKSRVDVIFTDIEMPEMNGLDFAAEARTILPNVRIVILSAYDKFSYAQKAISIGVFEYCLKPINTDMAEEVILKLKIELDKERGLYSEYKDAYGIKNVRFKNMIDYINKNYTKKLYLRDLAEMFDLNVTFCCSLFNKNLGCSFMEYCAKLKMEKAAELLKDGEMDAYEIADYLNYDYFYFNKLFKKHYGMTPRQYSVNHE